MEVKFIHIPGAYKMVSRDERVRFRLGLQKPLPGYHNSTGPPREKTLVSNQGGRESRIQHWSCRLQKCTPWAGRVAQAVEHLPSKHEAQYHQKINK
jgi:hypothetical protein